MTPETVEYYRLMLQVGIRDKLDAAFDEALETEEPLSDLVLSLCACISDNERVLACLREYTLNFKIDEQKVNRLIVDDLLERFQAGEMTRPEVVKTLYKIACILNKWSDTLWNISLYYYVDLFEDGSISEEVFNKCFDAWFFRGELLDPWVL